jgi:hypothetical protein
MVRWAISAETRNMERRTIAEKEIIVFMIIRFKWFHFRDAVKKPIP